MTGAQDQPGRMALLEARGLTKRYGGLVAIDAIDFDIFPGEVRGVIGPNGAGKSTLIGLFGGALEPSAGTIRLDQHDVSKLPASERARCGIGRTYQIPRPFLDMTVAENIEVAQYSIAPFISTQNARQDREELLDKTGLANAARLPARALPLLRRKRLEVARALALKPRLLMLDEVGAGLVDSEITELITLIRSVANGHTAILIVEHVIRVVRECCANTMVLNFGKKLMEGETSRILADDEVAAVYLGTGAGRSTPVKTEAMSAVADAPLDLGKPNPVVRPIGALVSKPAAREGRPPLLQLKNIHAGYGLARVLNGVDLTVEAGQAIAILGANGAGKTTLARVISGSLAPATGALCWEGMDLSTLGPHQRAAKGIAHCMEGRRIFPNLSVGENLIVLARDVPAAERRDRMEAVFDLFPVLRERSNQPGTSMSGGQQQMLAIGRALMARPRLIIFDEISLGLAPVVMDRLYEALERLKSAGITLLIIEQDVDRALALADYAYVLEHGSFGLSGAPEMVRNDARLRHIYVGEAE